MLTKQTKLSLDSNLSGVQRYPAFGQREMLLVQLQNLPKQP